MAIRAVIFDVYKTVLDVLPPPADAQQRWTKLWKELLSSRPPMSLEEFRTASLRCIEEIHQTAHTRGVAFPEVWWPDIVLSVLPELRGLSEREQDEFIYRQVQTGHQVRMNKTAAEVLRRLHVKGRLLGIASNAQQYTLRELGEALGTQSLSMALFAPDLCFWSFVNGFSKPDPHVFQLLSARLARRGIGPGETLMVGDRLDNDIEPARKFGWQTWQIAALPRERNPSWKNLLQFLTES